MKVTMMLADHAATAEGKLYISGGGWTVTGPDAIPSAIAMVIEIPWDQTDRKHLLRLELVDADGRAIMGQDDDGHSAPIELDGEFEVGRPPGLPAGAATHLPMAINIGPLPLAPGGRFAWNLFIDEETREHWVLPFSTRPRP